MDEARVRTLTGLLRRRGIIRQAYEEYGGVTGLYDYGPVGGRLLRRVQDSWREHFLSLGDIIEIDTPTLTPHAVLEASGHVGAFADHASECSSCGSIERSDHLLEGIVSNPDALSGEQLDSAIAENKVRCPNCGHETWGAARPLNLMFATTIGAMRGGRSAFMRPETAQGMFTSFPTILRHFREQLPFGAIQIGKGYRNEISPRQGIIRLREFNMAELEYFIDGESSPLNELSDTLQVTLLPDPINGSEPVQNTIRAAVDDGTIRHATVGWFMQKSAEWLLSIGVDGNRMRFRQHEGDEMAHYATDCWDLELHGSYGWIECVGVAHRGCYDLLAHERATGGGEFRAWRQLEEPIEIDRDELVPIGSEIGPRFREKAGAVKTAIEALDSPKDTPFELLLEDGTSVTIEEEMVQIRRVQKTITGEWHTPHVIEPAFGLDRIIWHLLDHSLDITEKEGDPYSILRIHPSIAAFDCVVLPLHTKGEMVDYAERIMSIIHSTKGLHGYIDAFGKSIGRRYARADEIGVPWAITIDGQSLQDETVTLRRRDDQSQTRVEVGVLIEALTS